MDLVNRAVIIQPFTLLGSEDWGNVVDGRMHKILET